MDDIFFMDAAYRQALKAKSKNEVPIGAVLVNNSGKIITQGVVLLAAACGRTDLEHALRISRTRHGVVQRTHGERW